MGSCRERSVYLTTLLLGRLSPLSGYVHILSPENLDIGVEVQLESINMRIPWYAKIAEHSPHKAPNKIRMTRKDIDEHTSENRTSKMNRNCKRNTAFE